MVPGSGRRPGCWRVSYSRFRTSAIVPVVGPDLIRGVGDGPNELQGIVGGELQLDFALGSVIARPGRIGDVVCRMYPRSRTAPSAAPRLPCWDNGRDSVPEFCRPDCAHNEIHGFRREGGTHGFILWLGEYPDAGEAAGTCRRAAAARRESAGQKIQFFGLMDGAFECTIALDFRGGEFGASRDRGRPLYRSPQRQRATGARALPRQLAWSRWACWERHSTAGAEWLGVTRGDGLLADVPSDTDDASESADQPSDRNQSAGTPSAGAALERDRRIGFGAALCQLGVIALAPFAIGQHGVGAAHALHLIIGKSLQGRCVALRIRMQQTHQIQVSFPNLLVGCAGGETEVVVMRQSLILLTSILDSFHSPRPMAPAISTCSGCRFRTCCTYPAGLRRSVFIPMATRFSSMAFQQM